MNENTLHLVDIPIGGKGGSLWNRLHEEREDICEALLTESEGVELLQSRLRKLDDALDRLMSGSYGHCSRCGRLIDDSRLDIDPALALCLDCWGREHDAARLTNPQRREARSACDLPLENVDPFDTILLKTHNSDYRILLLDPQNGRGLIEGGSYLTKPSEALLKGSVVRGSAFRDREICVGCRLEIWIDNSIFLTSPVKSIKVEHRTATEWAPEISNSLH